jgi:thiol:disulfide interchange protein DsbA
MISFSKKLFTLLTLFCLSGIVAAQGQKIEEGFDYRILPIAQPLDSKGKVEVIEFFWYGCPHKAPTQGCRFPQSPSCIS